MEPHKEILHLDFPICIASLYIDYYMPFYTAKSFRFI